MEMLWSLWRGVQSVDSTAVEDQQSASAGIENNNFINNVLPAEILERIFRLISNVKILKNIKVRKDKERHFCSRFLPPQDLKVAVAVCRSNCFLKLRNGSCKHNNAFVLTFTR